MPAILRVSTVKEQEGLITRLIEAYVKACHRERTAFMSGVAAALPYTEIEDMDVEQSWQQYRCKDDTDWSTSE